MSTIKRWSGPLRRPVDLSDVFIKYSVNLKGLSSVVSQKYIEIVERCLDHRWCLPAKKQTHMSPFCKGGLRACPITRILTKSLFKKSWADPTDILRKPASS